METEFFDAANIKEKYLFDAIVNIIGYLSTNSEDEKCFLGLLTDSDAEMLIIQLIKMYNLSPSDEKDLNARIVKFLRRKTYPNESDPQVKMYQEVADRLDMRFNHALIESINNEGIFTQNQEPTQQKLEGFTKEKHLFDTLNMVITYLTTEINGEKIKYDDEICAGYYAGDMAQDLLEYYSWDPLEKLPIIEKVIDWLEKRSFNPANETIEIKVGRLVAEELRGHFGENLAEWKSALKEETLDEKETPDLKRM